MAKKNYSRLKLLAEEMFVEKGYTLSRISEELSISPNTLTTWKNDGGWDNLRDYHQNSPHRVKQKLNKLMEQILDGKADNGEDLTDEEIKKMVVKANAVKSIKPALELLEKDVNPSVVFSVLVKLDNYSSQNYPDLAVKNLELHRSFIQTVVNEHG